VRCGPQGSSGCHHIVNEQDSTIDPTPRNDRGAEESRRAPPTGLCDPRARQRSYKREPQRPGNTSRQVRAGVKPPTIEMFRCRRWRDHDISGVKLSDEANDTGHERVERSIATAILRFKDDRPHPSGVLRCTVTHESIDRPWGWMSTKASLAERHPASTTTPASIREERIEDHGADGKPATRPKRESADPLGRRILTQG
jgi:hypothetical protein